MKQTLDVVAVIMNQCTVGDHGMIMLSYGNDHNQPYDQDIFMSLK